VCVGVAVPQWVVLTPAVGAWCLLGLAGLVARPGGVLQPSAPAFLCLVHLTGPLDAGNPCACSHPFLTPTQDGLAPRVSLFLSDVETESWPKGAVTRVANRTEATLVTLGDKGAHKFLPGADGPRLIEPVKVGAPTTPCMAGCTAHLIDVILYQSASAPLARGPCLVAWSLLP
jgi:hypothetical protein